MFFIFTVEGAISFFMLSVFSIIVKCFCDFEREKKGATVVSQSSVQLENY